jgi:hypothetical protein
MPVVGEYDESWSINGAERTQRTATVGKGGGREIG